MSETIAIILAFREEDAAQFEESFAAEVYPLWQEFKAAGKFIAASLTPVLEGNEQEPGIRHYILHVEVPAREGHSAFDSDPRFLQFLKKVRPLQPHQPKVWLGDTLFQI